MDEEPYPEISVTRIGLIVGTRPEFIKAASLLRAASAFASLRLELVHSGQHNDPALSEALVAELNLPPPMLSLDARGAAEYPTLPKMIAEMTRALRDMNWKAILTIGDTLTVLAATVAASRLRIEHIRIEAGPRSGNRNEPEEMIRTVADHSGSLLLAPTPHALRNLAHEGLEAHAEWTGDLTLDGYFSVPKRAPRWATPFALVTVHRPANVDDETRLQAIATALARAPIPVFWPAHPRVAGRVRSVGNLRVIAPLSFQDMASAIAHASIVVTDSGGVAREAAFAGAPVLVLATHVVWPELVEMGLVLPCDLPALQRHDTWITQRRRLVDVSCFGDGRAGERICAAIERWMVRHT